MSFKNINVLLCLALLVLTGCAGKTIEVKGTPHEQAKAIKYQGGMYKVGNPYKIFGTWYYPKEDYSYSEEGIASWYGKDFHAKKTANGEDYNMHTLTAAHRTLPLPSVVRVTNLANGRTLVLRVNDRGPYAKSRIIDISKRGAELLGYNLQGTTRVRVELLEKESKELKAALLGQAVEPVVAKKVIPQKVIPQKVVPKKEYVAIAPKASKPAYVSGEKKFYVQAGSFSTSEAAQDLSSKLSKYGKSKVAEAVVDGKKFYRVRLGPFNHSEEAEVSLARVRSYGVYNAKVVKD